MQITLNHTIVPAHDRIESTKWYAKIFGFEFIKEWGHFAVVKVNSTLTLDFMNKEDGFSFHHYAFKVNDRKFDEIFGRMKAENVKFSSNPYSVITNAYDEKMNHNDGGRGVYFKDPNGHILEILTVDYDLDTDPAYDRSL